MTRRLIGPASARAAVVAGTLLLVGCSTSEDVGLGAMSTVASAGASNPTLARAPEGNGVLVAWVGAGEVGSDVFIARVAAEGTTEGEPVRVNHIPGDADPHEQAPAQVAVGPGGEVYVVWQKKVAAPWLEFGGADLRLARSTDGGRTFEPAINVNDNPPGSPARMSFHNVAVGPDGTVFVSWIDARKRDAVREAAYMESSGGEGAGGAGGESGAGAAAPMAAHHSTAEPGTEIRVAVSHDGGATFGPSVVVDGDSCPCCRTALVAGPDGVVYIAWRKIFPGGIRDSAVARSTDGGATFSEPRAIHQDGWEFAGCPHAGPSLALDDEGRVHATWYTGKEGVQGLWYAVSDDQGDSFGEPLAILTDEWVPPSQARLAVDGETVWVAWDDLRQAEDRRVKLGRVENGRIREVEVDAHGNSPMLAVSHGFGGLAWQDGETVRLRMIGGGIAE